MLDDKIIAVLILCDILIAVAEGPISKAALRSEKDISAHSSTTKANKIIKIRFII